ncbi:MAG: hypothetical protein GQF41_0768 [Candidatus Rifleibacterium amylolyticum]|nr:MAG: hypothetical protein GQF41_0768 [Candidatus Rifleibacterium amylolyticum]
MQPESLNEFVKKSAEERINKLQNKYDPERAKPATFLFKLYLLAAFLMVVYATVFAVYGYHQLPLGREVAEFAGQLPTEFQLVDVDLLEKYNARAFMHMTKRQPLRSEPDRWLVNVKHGYALYNFRVVTDADEYPILKVYNQRGDEILNNSSPADYKPVKRDEQEKGGHLQLVYAGLQPGQAYLVEVASPGVPSGKHYVLSIRMREQEPEPYGLLILVGKAIVLTLPMAYFGMIILAVYLARKKPPVPGYNRNEGTG